MDDRWRFLYCMATELRGRMRGVRAGDGRPGASAGGETRRREAERRGVAKRTWRVPRKAAMARHAPVPQTDTGGQGEYPKAGGRSTAKELGKMAP